MDVKDLPFAIEEAMRIGTGDHIVATLVSKIGQSILGITQIGKVVHWTGDRLEIASTLKRKGQPMLSQRRRDTGVRFVGAVTVSEDDWGISLDREGWLTLHSMAEIIGNGIISTNSELLAFTSFSASIVKK